MREEFEKLAAAGKISRQQIEPLIAVGTDQYVFHRSWGVGKVATWDWLFSKVVIDFQGRPGHAMDLAFAADSLKAIPANHILARKYNELPKLREMAALHHLDLIKLVLQSYSGKATVDQIQQLLVPDVITEDWKKWWEMAKKEMKKDGHFQIPTKKTEPVVYQVQETSLKDRLIADFRAAKGLKAKIVVGNEFVKSFTDLGDTSVLNEVITGLDADIQTHQRTQPALALEAIFLRDELRGLAGLAAEANELNPAAIWSQVNKPWTILEAVSAAKHKRALQSFKEANPINWSEMLLYGINNTSTKLAGEIAALLIHEGRLQALKDQLARLISQHAASSELLLWMAKERSDAFADILGPEVFRAMLSSMERDQFNNESRRSNKLGDYIMNDQSLLVELIGSADLEIIKDLTRALQLSPCFDDMDKRSLLARIVKTYPAVQSLISGEQTKQDAALLVSWGSLERRKNEYTELVQKKIPANSKEIAIARSYGDLRENHEYKAAKEMQKVLMRRKSELEQQLVRARGMDFGNAKTDQVSLGTRVQVTDLTDNHAETFTILGAWDSNPEKGIISYLAPVGQALLNRKAGEEVDLDMDGNKRRFRIDSIGAYQPPVAPARPEDVSTDIESIQPESTPASTEQVHA
ncbi:MAG TPA: GreA/GreB family elongation factor [Verrucomicrobiae bacterium]|jgi:transcription elongation GreA/GreB family factor|nr:GreA/GreB family elongation factor [Verrucomicrobiae bacterium]